ncbi:pantoate--beta-alanine ligase [Acetobacterium sp.]|jgi:pantoate--beta-alanine ligase|uniref:pantoate--beta-alanine ligase n=1 Tax=Acetobacterium sp. TaxID=1872094 RepID=UPI000CC3B83E|nr:pantoate--beta-alanine ligase [Acetobacterium sp.]MBU4541556.1 pantoate--beta-alanine ligase [Bacillota bacterium]MDO9493480.1 pantoate--beta-alanine ligase [Acetobacterium sp.]PKM75202.1 MAG: pantoate--beta-alanine ligase [Firmicutes bacterium HGW-Firmicutes-17]
MKIAKTIAELKSCLEDFGRDKTIGFVPTMGYLHDGHLALINEAQSQNDVTVVSIFVNPTQFAPGEDLDAYPRDFDRDSQLAEAAGTDLLFFPDPAEIYPTGASTFVEVEGDITKKLCGQSRPTHFKGVTTVINLLFNLIQPTRAYFGQKDAQQVAVIKKMIRDLHMSVEIIVCPIVREADGLALSSRNVFLNLAARDQALVLSQSLASAKALYGSGERSVKIIKAAIINQITTMPLAAIDYVDILDFETLADIETITSPALAAVAVRFGNTRLIDNIILIKR